MLLVYFLAGLFVGLIIGIPACALSMLSYRKSDSKGTLHRLIDGETGEAYLYLNLDEGDMSFLDKSKYVTLKVGTTKKV